MPRRARDLRPPGERAFLALVRRHYREVRRWLRRVTVEAARRAVRRDAFDPFGGAFDPSREVTPAEAAAFVAGFQSLLSSRLSLPPELGGPPAPPSVDQIAAVGLPASRIAAGRVLAELRRLGIPAAVASQLVGTPLEIASGTPSGAILGGIIDPLTSPRVADGVVRWAEAARDYIVAIPREQLEQIPEWVARTAVAGRNWRELAEVVEQRLGVSERHAELIARDQTAKLNAAITEDLHQAAGITEYVWRAASDDRVRASHKAVSGQRFRWGDLAAGAGAPGVGFRGERGHPGQAGQCRCTAEPVPPAWWDEVREASRRRDQARADALVVLHLRRAA